MILLDSSVVMEFLRRPDPRMKRVFVDYDAAICGITRAEVLHGARSEIDRKRLLAALGDFPHLPIPDGLWDKLGANLAALRIAGRPVPFPDAVIATLAIEQQIELWARDSHFPMIQQTIPALRLFPDPLR